MTISARTAFMTAPLGRKEGPSPRGARARSPGALRVAAEAPTGTWLPGLSRNDCRTRICAWEFGPRYSFAPEVTGRGVRRKRAAVRTKARPAGRERDFPLCDRDILQAPTPPASGLRAVEGLKRRWSRRIRCRQAGWENSRRELNSRADQGRSLLPACCPAAR